MKTAIYIEDGLTQVVLTPQTDPERRALDLVKSAATVDVKTGRFFECRGGYMRKPDGTESTMIVCRQEGE